MKAIHRDIQSKDALRRKQRNARAFQSPLDFSNDSLIVKLFGMELLDNENKLVIIESIVQEICDLHQEMEDTKGAVMHDIGFQKQLRRALEAFYRYIPNKNKYNWGGIAYYEISYGRKQFLRLNNPCELLKN